MGYDVMGHKTSMKDPDLGNWSYVVDAAGRTRQQTDAKSQVTTYTYDPLNRLTERLEPDLDSHWTFDTAANGVGELAESYTWIAATSTKDYRRVYAYDSLSRPSSSTTTLDWDYTELNTYDSFGHLATVTHRRSAIGAANVASNPTGTGTSGLSEIQYTLGYNSQGAVGIVVRGATTLWTLNAQDAAGRTRLATFGSGLATATGYNVYTGYLWTIQTGLGNGSGGVNPSIQSDSYGYDAVGNLLNRTWLPASAATAMSETFTYDALDRLQTSQVSGLDLKSFGYDALGDITSKTNVGTYAYPAANTAHPHLLSGITGTVGGLTNPSFAYDANGNTQSGLNRLYAWSAANLPVSVDQLSNGTSASATLRHEFLYGPERDRTREIVRAMSGTTIGAVQRTIYSADSIEKEIDAVAGTTKIRTYLPLGLGFTEEDFTGTAIAPTSVGTPVERYFHKDNLGSLVIVTDASQAVLERMAYDAWGRRRQSNGLEVGWQYLNAQSAANTLDHHGYTGQEQLDDLSLVHLNGRVYDPMTGRMTSPDPTIPDPYDLQSLNRASYVRNSPMDKTDPTGFFDIITGSDIKPVGGAQGAGTGAAGTVSVQYADHSQDGKENTPAPAQAKVGKNPTGTVAAAPGSDAKGPNAQNCGSACEVTGANTGEHGLPFGVTREEQQKVDQQAGKIALEGASVVLTPELLGLKVAGGAAKGMAADAQFAQKTYGAMFSEGGTFAGKTVNDVAAALRSGAMKAADVPVEFIVRDGKSIILNTRSAEALNAAGVPRAQWNAVNRTGDAAAEARLSGQLSRNSGGPFDTVRPSGGK